MTSHVRQGQNVYNGVKAPRYNVLSYTWGYFQDKAEPPLVVYGLNWPVPGIKRSHFTVHTFHRAILAAATGIKHRCKWLWVDIACIPQEHTEETKEAELVRHQEIGRQVGIFHRAEESFAWFSSLNKIDLFETHGSLSTVEKITEHMNLAWGGFDIPQDATNFLNELEDKIESFESWMSIIIDHPWLLSLWTLQEMVLRPDAYTLFDDGFLDINKTYHNIEADNEGGKTSPWRFSSIKNDVWSLRTILTDRNRIKALEAAESIALSVEARPCKGQISRILGTLQRLVDEQIRKGLTALEVEIPNTAYSMAQHRRVERKMDRILGIMQTYGIVCDPDPSGDDDDAKLRVLEEDFGRKLVAKSPVISQLFIHTNDERPPRRSWLITQLCKADDLFWQGFSSKCSPRDHFTRFEIVERYGVHKDMAVELQGKAWNLDAFVTASSPFSKKNSRQVQEQLYRSSRTGFHEKYRGLMLDHHISRATLGHVVDYFDDHESMSNTVQALHKVFCGASQLCIDCPKFQVALLGSGITSSKTPVVDYVGLVLASPPEAFRWRTTTGHMESDVVDQQVPETTSWRRIGLMRWTEIYHISRKAENHSSLPPYHDLKCIIT
jgi:hypothetical protein